MLTDHDILCISLAPWEGAFEGSYHQVMGRLARHNRVLYVDPPVTWRDLWRGEAYRRSPAQLEAARQQAGGVREVTTADGARLHVLTPPAMAPTNFLPDGRLYDLAMRAAGAGYRRAIARALDALAMPRPLVWSFFSPVLAHELPVDPRLLVYHCVDEVASEPWIAAHGVPRERSLLARADLVLTSSPGLQAAKAPQARACRWIPHGVDAALFAQALAPQAAAPRPPELADLTGPIFGMVGQLEARVDFDALAALADARPDATVVLVGALDPRVAEAARPLLARPNVRLLGQRPRAELPALVATFDVALVPYVRSLQTAAVYPLKLHEYLAAGRRVVATDFAPLPAGDGLAPTIASAADFPAAVLAALATPAPTPAEALAHGRRHDWDVRVAAIGEAVAAALAAKEGGAAFTQALAVKDGSGAAVGGAAGAPGFVTKEVPDVAVA